MIKYILMIMLLLISCLLNGQDYNDLDARLFDVIQEYDTIGATVLLVEGNDSHEFSFGFRDYERQLRVNSNTKYRIASISKIITAIGAMKLVEEGLLELDTDVSSYLGFEFRNPNFPEVEITVRDIMTHISSIRDGNGYSNFQSASYNNNPPSISELFLASGQYYQSNVWSSTHAPGSFSGWDYSNLGSGVLATIIESVSNQHFHDYLDEILFEPLDIDYCWGNFSNLSDINDLAVLYRIYGGNPQAQVDDYNGVTPTELDYDNMPIGSNALMYGPQGNLRISGQDLAKILIMYKNRGNYGDVEVLSPFTIGLMEDINWNGSGLGGFFTEMGLQLQRTYDLFTGELFIGHAGEAYGLISDMYYNLERDIGIIFITNGANYAQGNSFYDLEEGVFQVIEQWLDATPNSDDLSPMVPEVYVYPSVVGKNQHLRVEADDSLQKVEIYNVKGQKLRTLSVRNKGESISLNGFANGLYLVKVKTKKQVKTSKILLLK